MENNINNIPVVQAQVAAVDDFSWVTPQLMEEMSYEELLHEK